MPTIEQMKVEAEKARRKIAMLQTKIAKQARAQDTRRKVLMGAAVVDLCGKQGEFRRIFEEHLDRFISRTSDRALLQLEVKEDDADANSRRAT